MAKLHELLGSQKQTFGQAQKVITDLLATFDKRKEHFREKIVTYKADAEGSQPVTEEQSNRVTTIPQEIKWLTSILSRALDTEAQIDKGNTVAQADVLLDDGETILLKAVPATQLLQLDKRLTELQQFVSLIPTHDPVKGFTPDPDQVFGVYKAREVTKRRTKKDQVPIQLTPTTKEHPGTAQLITKDVEVGTIHEQEWSSLTTPQIKAALLERVEELRRAVKKARARANDVVVPEVQIGKTLLDYVFTPLLGE